MPQGRAALLDRDGVINVGGVEYVTSWDEFQFIPGALEALRRLRQARWLTLVVTNQSAVARGMLSREELDEMHRRMAQQVEEAGGRIAGIYVCPHHPDDGCACRKPRTGLLQQAARDWGLDLTRSYMVGDSWRDIEAGQRVGMTTIMVEGAGPERAHRERERLSRPPDFVARDLAAAVDVILESEDA